MMAINDIKKCSKCGEEKPVSEFNKDKNRADGFYPQCKCCRRKYREENRDREVARCSLWYEENREREIVKKRAYYAANKDDIRKSQHEYYENNKSIISEKNKEYREKNKEYFDACNRRWREENRDHLRAYGKKWRNDNKEHKKEADRKWQKDNRGRINKLRGGKYKSDVQYRLSVLLRGRLNDVLGGRIKGGSAVRDLGCSLEELKGHIESLFIEGMSWDNHGKYGWHVDHILPLSSFDLTDREQLLIACNYKNLQPLWAYDNLSKGDKIEICEEVSGS